MPADFIRVLAEFTPVDWIGVVGSFLIAGAYFAATRGRLNAEGPFFNLLNLTGALFILLSLWYRPNAGAIMIEVLWSLIAVSALLRWALRRKD